MSTQADTQIDGETQTTPTPPQIPTKPPTTTPKPPLTTSPTLPSKPSPPNTYFLSQTHDLYLDWSLKILGVASAILFGIWAPISFKITAEANTDNDAAQASLLSQISSLQQQAATAASAQASAVSALARVNGQLKGLGELRVWEFCEGKASTVSACAEVSSNGGLEALVTSLAGLVHGASSSTAASSALPSPSSAPHGAAPDGRVSKDVLAIVLGSVFGAVVVFGFVVGCLVVRRRQRKILVVDG